MKNKVIRPSKARAVGVITPPLSEMLALDEETNTNHFVDVRVVREAGADNTYKGATRKTQTIGADNLDVAITAEQVTFYKEYPEQGWFRVHVQVAGTDTYVNRGNIKIYVKDADGILDSYVLVLDYDIPDSRALGWQITGLEYWSDVLDAFLPKSAHPFRCYNVKIVYTDSTHYYMNKTQTFSKKLCYSTHPILHVYVCNGTAEELADYQNTCLEELTIDTSSTPLVNKSYTLEVPSASRTNVRVAFYCYLEDATGARIFRVPFKWIIQDTQEAHTISNTPYAAGADMDIGHYNNTVEQSGKHYIHTISALWLYQFTSAFMATSQSRTRRHANTTLLFELDNNLFHGGTGLRASAGFELRVQWNYMQPVTFTSFSDNSTYSVRNFNYYLNVVDEHGTDVQCQLLAKVNGVTIKDSNDTVLLWSRNSQTGLFNVDFDFPYLHAGSSTVELKVIPEYDFESDVYTVTANCPLLHYNISSPTIISGSWDADGIIELEYTVGTIENDELPYCEIWDLKIDDQTVYARDKTMVGGEWNGQYNTIVGGVGLTSISWSYNASTGALRMKFDKTALPPGTHTLKLVLPQTDAITGGYGAENIYVQSSSLPYFTSMSITNQNTQTSFNGTTGTFTANITINNNNLTASGDWSTYSGNDFYSDYFSTYYTGGLLLFHGSGFCWIDFDAWGIGNVEDVDGDAIAASNWVNWQGISGVYTNPVEEVNVDFVYTISNGVLQLSVTSEYLETEDDIAWIFALAHSSDEMVLKSNNFDSVVNE